MIKKKRGKRKNILREASERLSQEGENKRALSREPGTNSESRKLTIKDRSEVVVHSYNPSTWEVGAA